MSKFKTGDIVENCNFHPMLLVVVDYKVDNMMGISLINGELYNCSTHHCGCWVMTPEQAYEQKKNGPPAESDKFFIDDKWWV